LLCVVSRQSCWMTWSIVSSPSMTVELYHVTNTHNKFGFFFWLRYWIVDLLLPRFTISLVVSSPNVAIVILDAAGYFPQSSGSFFIFYVSINFKSSFDLFFSWFYSSQTYCNAFRVVVFLPLFFSLSLSFIFPLANFGNLAHRRYFLSYSFVFIFSIII